MAATYTGINYKMVKSYRSGTRFRIYISNNEPAFVYALGTDATGKIFPLFPYAENISPALNYKKNDVALPDEDHFIEMDNTVGTDYLCVLYSLDPLDFNQIQQDIESGTGNFISNIKTALGNKMVENQSVKFNQSSISFTAKSQGKTVVAIVVETKHTK
jgi:hypothetical protein